MKNTTAKYKEELIRISYIVADFDEVLDNDPFFTRLMEEKGFDFSDSGFDFKGQRRDLTFFRPSEDNNETFSAVVRDLEGQFETKAELDFHEDEDLIAFIAEITI